MQQPVVRCCGCTHNSAAMAASDSAVQMALAPPAPAPPPTRFTHWRWSVRIRLARHGPWGARVRWTPWRSWLQVTYMRMPAIQAKWRVLSHWPAAIREISAD